MLRTYSNTFRKILCQQENWHLQSILRQELLLPTPHVSCGRNFSKTTSNLPSFYSDWCICCAQLISFLLRSPPAHPWAVFHRLGGKVHLFRDEIRTNCPRCKQKAMFSLVCQPPVAAVTKCHRTGAKNNRNFFSRCRRLDMEKQGVNKAIFFLKV